MQGTNHRHNGISSGCTSTVELLLESLLNFYGFCYITPEGLDGNDQRAVSQGLRGLSPGNRVVQQDKKCKG